MAMHESQSLFVEKQLGRNPAFWRWALPVVTMVADDEASRAVLVPANRFEVLECEAARDAVLAGELDGELG